MRINDIFATVPRNDIFATAPRERKARLPINKLTHSEVARIAAVGVVLKGMGLSYGRYIKALETVMGEVLGRRFSEANRLTIQRVIDDLADFYHSYGISLKKNDSEVSS